jgi:biopolymer transport protein TolR
MMAAGGGQRRPMSEINVTPLVDVVLVLLIIFMVTAPFLQGGLEIDLPRVATQGLDVHEGLIVSIRADLTLAVGQAVVSPERFEDALVKANASRRPVFLKADTSVPYGTIVGYIARMRHAGVVQLGLVTQPPAKRKP